MLLYWTTITLGPLLMGTSLVMMSQFMAVSRGAVPDLVGNLRWFFSVVEFFLLAEFQLLPLLLKLLLMPMPQLILCL